MNSYKGQHTNEEIEASFRKAQKERKKKSFHWCDVIVILGLLVLVFNLQVLWDPLYEVIRYIQVDPFVAAIIGVVGMVGYCFLRCSPQKLLEPKKDKKAEKSQDRGF